MKFQRKSKKINIYHTDRSKSTINIIKPDGVTLHIMKTTKNNA